MSTLISVNKLHKLAEGCGLSDFAIYNIYKLLRKTIVLDTMNHRKSFEDRRKINGELENLLAIVEKSPCTYLKNKLLTPLKFEEANDILEAHEKKLSLYNRERLILNHRVEIYKKFLEWDASGESGKTYVSAIAARLDRRRKKVLGQRTWKYGLLGGVTLALGGIYLYSKAKKEEDKK